MKTSIVFIHLGNEPLPAYAVTNILLTRKIAKNSKIYVIYENANAEFLEKINSLDDIEIVSIDTINSSPETIFFRENFKLDRKFRSGFWYHTSERFFVLADFIEQNKIENIIHLENDYLIYFDPEDIDIFKNYGNFLLPLDRIRAIPGIVCIRDLEIIRNLTKFINRNLHLNDMYSLGNFTKQTKNESQLPTIPCLYVEDKKLKQEYSTGIEKFNGIFDAAAIGQYLGGVDRKNDPEDTMFFLNESSDLNLNDFTFQWNIINAVRKPSITYKTTKTNILGLHVHSKKIIDFSPFGTGIQNKEDEYITGEKIQSLCDVTISTKTITNYHGSENIKTKELIEIPELDGFKLGYFEADNFKNLEKYKKIFVYTHLIPYFKKYIAPRLDSKYILVTHNSDHEISINDLALLNQPNLVAWYGQNVTFSHDKLYPLPIGLQNKQFGQANLNTIYAESRVVEKSKLIFANFNKSTHPSRNVNLDFLRSIPRSTFQQRVHFDFYIRELARHKFCLCPRGNGIDTHRFWECQYLDTIPIILQKDWTPSYSNLPVLAVDDWSDIKKLDLEKIYIRIINKNYDRSSLLLSEIEKKFNLVL